MTTTDQLREFHGFVAAKLAAERDRHPSPEEALDEWRALHADREEIEEVAAEIRASLADVAAGNVLRRSAYGSATARSWIDTRVGGRPRRRSRACRDTGAELFGL